MLMSNSAPMSEQNFFSDSALPRTDYDDLFDFDDPNEGDVLVGMGNMEMTDQSEPGLSPVGTQNGSSDGTSLSTPIIQTTPQPTQTISPVIQPTPSLISYQSLLQQAPQALPDGCVYDNSGNVDCHPILAGCKQDAEGIIHCEGPKKDPQNPAWQKYECWKSGPTDWSFACKRIFDSAPLLVPSLQPSQPIVAQPIVAQPTEPIITQPYQPDPYQSDPYQSDPYQSDPYQSDPYQPDPYQSDPYQSDPYQSPSQPTHLPDGCVYDNSGNMDCHPIFEGCKQDAMGILRCQGPQKDPQNPAWQKYKCWKSDTIDWSFACQRIFDSAPLPVPSLQPPPPVVIDYNTEPPMWSSPDHVSPAEQNCWDQGLFYDAQTDSCFDPFKVSSDSDWDVGSGQNLEHGCYLLPSGELHCPSSFVEKEDPASKLPEWANCYSEGNVYDPLSKSCQVVPDLAKQIHACYEQGRAFDTTKKECVSFSELEQIFRDALTKKDEPPPEPEPEPKPEKESLEERESLFNKRNILIGAGLVAGVTLIYFFMIKKQ